MTRYRAISTELHIMRRWIPDWLAGHIGLELPNPCANYLFGGP